MVLKIALNSVLNLLNWEHDCWIIFIYTLNGIIFTLEILPLSCFVKSFSTFLSLQGLVNDKDSKDSMTEGENLEEDEEEEEGGAETEEQSGNESEENEPEEEVMTFIYSR